MTNAELMELQEKYRDVKAVSPDHVETVWRCDVVILLAEIAKRLKSA